MKGSGRNNFPSGRVQDLVDERIFKINEELVQTGRVEYFSTRLNNTLRLRIWVPSISHTTTTTATYTQSVSQYSHSNLACTNHDIFARQLSNTSSFCPASHFPRLVTPRAIDRRGGLGSRSAFLSLFKTNTSSHSIPQYLLITTFPPIAAPRPIGPGLGTYSRICYPQRTKVQRYLTDFCHLWMRWVRWEWPVFLSISLFVAGLFRGELGKGKD